MILQLIQSHTIKKIKKRNKRLESLYTSSLLSQRFYFYKCLQFSPLFPLTTEKTFINSSINEHNNFNSQYLTEAHFYLDSYFRETKWKWLTHSEFCQWWKTIPTSVRAPIVICFLIILKELAGSQRRLINCFGALRFHGRVSYHVQYFYEGSY